MTDRGGRPGQCCPGRFRAGTRANAPHWFDLRRNAIGLPHSNELIPPCCCRELLISATEPSPIGQIGTKSRLLLFDYMIKDRFHETEGAAGAVTSMDTLRLHTDTDDPRKASANERISGPGSTLFREGAAAFGPLVLREGWAFRYKSLSDGRRQILGYFLPGDVIGFQSSLFPVVDHGVEALTVVRYSITSLGYLIADGLLGDPRDPVETLARFAAAQERVHHEHLLTLGRRSAIERLAFIILTLSRRVRALGLARDGRIDFPLTQQHLADTLGLSLVHTNKTLRRLTKTDCIAWKGRSLQVRDDALLARIAGLAPA